MHLIHSNLEYTSEQGAVNEFRNKFSKKSTHESLIPSESQCSTEDGILSLLCFRTHFEGDDHDMALNPEMAISDVGEVRTQEGYLYTPPTACGICILKSTIKHQQQWLKAEGA